MELINVSIKNNMMPQNIVACVGEFDGVHIGHQK
jgi:FAD synthase